MDKIGRRGFFSRFVTIPAAVVVAAEKVEPVESRSFRRTVGRGGVFTAGPAFISSEDIDWDYDPRSD